MVTPPAAGEWIDVAPTTWPGVHVLLPGLVGEVATAPRHSVDASGLPSWPPGRCSTTSVTGFVVALLNVVLTCSDGERTGSLFGQVADAVHVTVGFVPLPSSTNAPVWPNRKLPGALKMAFAATDEGTPSGVSTAWVSVGLLASRVTEKVARLAALAESGTSAHTSSAPAEQSSRRRRLPALVVIGLPMAAVGVR